MLFFGFVCSVLDFILFFCVKMSVFCVKFSVFCVRLCFPCKIVFCVRFLCVFGVRFSGF